MDEETASMNGWQRWVELWDRREPADALALFRTGLGLALMISVGSVIWTGNVELLWIDERWGGYRHTKGSWLVNWLGGGSPAIVWGLCLVSMWAGTCLALGVFPRLHAAVGGQTFFALCMLNPHAKGSDDALLSAGLWLLVFARSGQTRSVVTKWRTGSWVDESPVPAWPRFLAVFQLAVMYHFTALQKVSAAWIPLGDLSALYYILQQPSWQRWPMEWLAWVYPLTQLGTAVVWTWELTWPVVGLWLLLRELQPSKPWMRVFLRYDLRTVYALVGVALHLGIFAFMQVGPFTWIVLAFYPCLFAPEELRAFARKIEVRKVLATSRH